MHTITQSVAAETIRLQDYRDNYRNGLMTHEKTVLRQLEAFLEFTAPGTLEVVKLLGTKR